MLTAASIKNTLQILGFMPVEGKNGVWTKHYTATNYTITVSFGKTVTDSKIDYGKAIKAGRGTTQNFSQEESLVVLECVDRLLSLGYPPESLVLEKQYPLGHTGGFLDILILQDNKPYLMVECKTWGREFEQEKAKLFSVYDSQLLSYYPHDRGVKFIALYASRTSSNAMENRYCAIDTSILHGDSLTEIFDDWDKSYFEQGAFEGIAYEIQETRLTKTDLEDMTAEDGGKIFNAFAEILRRHVISDKPNAFNKIFNLFICKVQDEEKQEDETLDFQWQAGESAETVLNRLNDLYKVGMLQFLDMEITDHTESEINKRLGGNITDSDRQALHTIFTELRLYKNNEFAFKEVFDRETFHANAEVVREVVRLLQKKRLRYTSKQQFMGDFFERLLNTSVKQEAGQFFTPIPIARFVIDSLPLQAMIDEKLKNNDNNFLPYLIDYASGSGHFLTESMDRVDRMLKSLGTRKLRRTQQDNWDSWSKNYRWAKEFIYGVEKDYRLSKTAKVSCFLNGDGDANVICGDGLDHFSLCDKYKGKLHRQYQGEGEQDNQQFDVLVANPPYSVSACKKTIKHGEKSFSLFPRLTDASSEIECLFIERAKQLLKTGGVAGVLLPSSILSNGGIYEATREIILKHFEIKALAVMGSSTFMATGTSTVILFIQRRDNSDWIRIEGLIADFLTRWQDMTVTGRENAFAHYSQTVWSLSLDDYIAMLKGDAVPDHSLNREYRQDFDNSTVIRNLKGTKKFLELTESEQQDQLDAKFRQYLLNAEKDKLLYFFLIGEQQVVISRAPGDKQTEKVFLGYEFSNSKGREGLKILSNTGVLETALYSESEPANPDKINTLIRNNFLGNELSISTALAEYVTISPLLKLMTFDRVRFDKAIATTVKKKALNSRWPLVRLGNILALEYGNSLPKAKRGAGSYPVVGSNGVVGTHNDFFVEGPAVIVGRKGSVGKVTWIEENCCPIDTTFYVVPISKESSLQFLYNLLNWTNLEQLNSGLGPGGMNRNDAYELLIPFPPDVIQQTIVNECEIVSRHVAVAQSSIENAKETINEKLKAILSQQSEIKRLPE